ncbi:deoxyribodipyrimidine photo-lyase [Streptomyces sp. NPDC048420]|uniref:deoxyribodipyrimidine photo-lyase n=1 Tax=Streptomyces sp. NPDC048420 TaxID=3155755 RepID=UPI00343456A6
MSISIVLFTCDLRLHDHPPLRAALDGTEQVVPLFVRDRAVDAAGFAVPNRLAFLADCLRDLDAGLRERGGRLVVRTGDLVDEVCKVAVEADADEVHMASDVSAHAHRREERGAYVRRWIPELAGLEGPMVHEPWKLRGLDRAAFDYPHPLLELSDGLARFRRGRGRD